ncbi:translation initiation factor IF-2-like [Mirounga leonina]|uniref:translation initiation factor IF-2-like n=1 Tax=Mirounga leonina TaxID=9715 RepID=UPI00156C5216|nr:translation initiation factor IF-2-like [Mirounga leonina]
MPGFRKGDYVRAAPQPEVCPGSRAPSSLCERRAGPAACGPAGAAKQLRPRRPAPDGGVAEQGRLRPGVAGPALPSRRGEGEPADRAGSEGPRPERSWRAPGTERAPASAATLQRASRPAGTEAPVPGAPAVARLSRVGRSEPRAMPRRRWSRRNEALDLTPDFCKRLPLWTTGTHPAGDLRRKCGTALAWSTHR